MNADNITSDHIIEDSNLAENENVEETQSDEKPNNKRTNMKIIVTKTGFFCPYEECHKFFHLKESVRSHIRRIHKKYRSKPAKRLCPLCGKEFMNHPSYTSHYRTHFPELMFTCRYCGKKFGDKSQFKHHELSHEGYKPNSCDLCDYKSMTRTQLKVSF